MDSYNPMKLCDFPLCYIMVTRAVTPYHPLPGNWRPMRAQKRSDPPSPALLFGGTPRFET